jgi:hypothetical protein
MAKKKNPAVVALGKLGAAARNANLSDKEKEELSRKAGKAHMTTVTVEERRRIAKLATKGRWTAKKEKENG